jgi:hypothetical protein
VPTVKWKTVLINPILRTSSATQTACATTHRHIKTLKPPRLKSLSRTRLSPSVSNLAKARIGITLNTKPPGTSTPILVFVAATDKNKHYGVNQLGTHLNHPNFDDNTVIHVKEKPPRCPNSTCPSCKREIPPPLDSTCCTCSPSNPGEQVSLKHRPLFSFTARTILGLTCRSKLVLRILF